MKSLDNALLYGYENMRLFRYDNELVNCGKLIDFRELPYTSSNGVLKACFRNDDRLLLNFSGQDSHACVIAGTGLGKTTSFVMQQTAAFLLQKKKRSMLISDPKGELYRLLAALFRKNGYSVLQYNFRNPLHSECWNPFSGIFKKYQSAFEILSEVGSVVEGNEIFKTFRGKKYRTKKELDEAIAFQQELIFNEAGNEIDKITLIMFVTRCTKDPAWEDAAREILRAILWGLLEDSRKENLPADDDERGIRQLITEDVFSINSVLTILDSFEDDSNFYDDKGFFRSRKDSSRAKKYVNSLLLNNAPVTRRGIISVLNTGISVFRETAMSCVMCANTVDFSSINERPTVIFITYKDEVKVHYQVISMMVQDIYCSLIETANKSGGKLEVPFYFILDEFGNFPAITDFDTTISACRGRNIFFILVIQSYAQLNSVYGGEVSEIIRDNLNIHVFFGSNNPKTLDEFSDECGKTTRISPLSALNGDGAEINNFSIETIPLVPRSSLTCFEEGECVVTEANSGYVLRSKIERYYKCREFSNLELSDDNDYEPPVNPHDKKYKLKTPQKRQRKKLNDWNF